MLYKTLMIVVASIFVTGCDVPIYGFKFISVEKNSLISNSGDIMYFSRMNDSLSKRSSMSGGSGKNIVFDYQHIQMKYAPQFPNADFFEKHINANKALMVSEVHVSPEIFIQNNVNISNFSIAIDGKKLEKIGDFVCVYRENKPRNEADCEKNSIEKPALDQLTLKASDQVVFFAAFSSEKYYHNEKSNPSGKAEENFYIEIKSGKDVYWGVLGFQSRWSKVGSRAMHI